MTSSSRFVTMCSFSILMILFGAGCASLNEILFPNNTVIDNPPPRPPRGTVAYYEAEGMEWGRKHWQEGRKPSSINPTVVDDALVAALIDPNDLDFFWVHSDLKNAFKKGYRLGYQDRTADLVLGPNITAAATAIGTNTANKFVDTITTFEQEWAATIRRTVDIFIALLSEGSQSDREQFIAEFTEIYQGKYASTQQLLKTGATIRQRSEGGTMLYLDYSKGKILGALDIPAPDSLKGEVYRQAFKVMGDEWGRRYSTNLIERDELVNLLRRSKTAMQETPSDIAKDERLKRNMDIIREAFIAGYGTDAENVFQSICKDAGYTIDW